MNPALSFIQDRKALDWCEMKTEWMGWMLDILVERLFYLTVSVFGKPSSDSERSESEYRSESTTILTDREREFEGVITISPRNETWSNHGQLRTVNEFWLARSVCQRESWHH